MAANWLSSTIDPPDTRARSLATPRRPEPPAQGRYGGPSALASPVFLVLAAVIATTLVVMGGLTVLLYIAISHAAGAH